MSNKVISDSLEQELAQLEAIGNDDILLISEFGPSYYETEELLDLLFYLKTADNKLAHLHKVLLSIALLFTANLTIVIVCFLNSRLVAGYMSLCFIPVLALTAWLYTYYFHKKNGDIRQVVDLKNMIEAELERRNY